MAISRTTAGETVSGADRVNQQFDMIIETAKGSVLGDPKFGLDSDIQDLPVSEIIGALIANLNEQTALYLPDIIIDSISKEVTQEGVEIYIKWSTKTGSSSGELRRTI